MCISFAAFDNAVINVWDKQTNVPTDILYVQTADKFVECLWHRVNEKSQVTMPQNENDGKNDRLHEIYRNRKCSRPNKKKTLIKSDTQS